MPTLVEELKNAEENQQKQEELESDLKNRKELSHVYKRTIRSNR